MIKKISNLKKKKEAEKLPARITNDTVAQHREKVLAGGRKLKYPHQYTRRTLVRNAIIIGVGALLLFVAVVGAQLYLLKDTSDWAYRVTRVLPLPVAQIDGEYVKYSDYHLYYRSTVAVLISQGHSVDSLSNDRMKFQKQQAMDRALEDVYAKKIAQDKNIELPTDQQANERIDQQRKESGLSEGAYATAINDHLHWTMDELRLAMKNTILRQNVAYAVDSEAKKLSDSVEKRISAGEDLKTIAQSYDKSVEFQENVSVPKDNSDGGLSVAASKLEPGKTSKAIKTLAGDGYYFITRLSSDSNTISYSYIRVPLTVFAKDFKATKDSDSTKIFISLD